MAEIAELLAQMRDGNRDAISQVMARIYDELHRLAAAYIRRERPDHTLQTTVLVHEAYLRLVGQREAAWKNRAHFLGVAAQMMRRVVVDHARAHLRLRRGGAQQRVSLEGVAFSNGSPGRPGSAR
jgi:RNA polymerase sigma factor (TIGR02999 family)